MATVPNHLKVVNCLLVLPATLNSTNCEIAIIKFSPSSFPLPGLSSLSKISQQTSEVYSQNKKQLHPEKSEIENFCCAILNNCVHKLWQLYYYVLYSTQNKKYTGTGNAGILETSDQHLHPQSRETIPSRYKKGT